MEVALPPSAINPLREILEQIGAGNGVTILPQRVELTTQEAADLLNVSRPHLVKLLDQGTIPSFRVGTHRRVRARDVAIYAEQARSASGRILDQLVAEAQELGLGY
jgi:excisionase family DNA binding protein